MRNNTEDSKVFKALCDEKRLQILGHLRDGEKCVCHLLEYIDLCQSSLSYHMKILVESGIVTGRQEGKWTYYSISKEGSDRAAELLKILTAVENEQQCEPCCDDECTVGDSEVVSIEYMYIDLESCERCVSTDQVLEQVIETIKPALDSAGLSVEYRKILIDSEETARKYEFLSSPTIRVNGLDIGGPVEENDCGCCSDISGSPVDCRLFVYKGTSYEIPPVEILSASILETVFGPEQEINCNCEYEVPENLKKFFKGKEQKECKCHKGCC